MFSGVGLTSVRIIDQRNCPQVVRKIGAMKGWIWRRKTERVAADEMLCGMKAEEDECGRKKSINAL